MSVLIEYAMFPTDKGISVSQYVARIIKLLEAEKVNYQLTPMGTIAETDTLEGALSIVQKSYEQLSPDCDRVYSTIKLDIKKHGEKMMQQKVESVKSKL